MKSGRARAGGKHGKNPGAAQLSRALALQAADPNLAPECCLNTTKCGEKLATLSFPGACLALCADSLQEQSNAGLPGAGKGDLFSMKQAERL